VNPESTPAPRKYTQQELGKLRRQFFTKEYGRVNKCGHKFCPTDEPHDKCEDCWEAYFMVNDGIRIGVESIVRSFGMQQLVKVRGERFAKMYKRFVAAHPETIRGDKVAA
jgi:hypothetical protein